MATLNSVFWRDRPTLVTGATGLVGGWMVKRLLAAGADVICLVRDWVPQSELIRGALLDRVKVVRGDICDQTLLERALGEYEVDTVLHLAAQTIVGIANRNPVSTFESNIQGTWALLEACRAYQKSVKRIVIASSDKAYGAQPQLPYTEDMPLSGTQPYEVSKSCTDLIARSYYVTYNLPIAIARCGNIYGGGDLNWSRIVPDTIRSLLRNMRPIIRSDGSYIRDYIYVKDVCNAYLCLAELLVNENVRGEAFNFSPERAVTALELVNIIRTLMQRDDLLPDIQNTAQGEIHSQYLSAEKAHRVLGWKAQFNLDEGLMETIAWYSGYLTHSGKTKQIGVNTGD